MHPRNVAQPAASVEVDLAYLDGPWATGHAGEPVSGGEPLTVVATLEGEELAKVTGLVAGQWLVVDELWLAPLADMSSMASVVMGAAESEARSRGCRGVRLATDSSATADKVAQLGYRVADEVPDIFGLHAHYYLWKPLF